MKLDVVLEHVLPYPVDAVWRQLTDREAISEWLMATADFEPRVGARFTMRTGHLSSDGWVRAEVLELEPPRRMVWAWSVQPASEPTTVTFELQPADEGTLLKLAHAGEIDESFGRLLEDGWPTRIELLRRSLA